MTGWPNGYCGDLGLLDSKYVYFTPITLSNETRGRALPLSPCSTPPPGNLLGVAPPPFDKTMRIASVRSSLGTIKVEHARTLESRVGQRLSSSGTSSIPVIESERTRSRPPSTPKSSSGQLSRGRPLPNDDGAQTRSKQIQARQGSREPNPFIGPRPVHGFSTLSTRRRALAIARRRVGRVGKPRARFTQAPRQSDGYATSRPALSNVGQSLLNSAGRPNGHNEWARP